MREAKLDFLPDYISIREDGAIISRYRGMRILKVQMTKGGYLQIKISNKSYLVHRLVAYAFLESNDCKLDVNHIDGIKTNNNVDNLEWVTDSENKIHAYANNLMSAKGTDNGNAKDVNYWSNKPTLRYHFKNTHCKTHNLNFDDFEEVFAEWYTKPNGRRERRYFYILKQDCGHERED